MFSLHHSMPTDSPVVGYTARDTVWNLVRRAALGSWSHYCWTRALLAAQKILFNVPFMSCLSANHHCWCFLYKRSAFVKVRYISSQVHLNMLFGIGVMKWRLFSTFASTWTGQAAQCPNYRIQTIRFYRKKKQKFSLMHEMATRRHWLHVSFTILSKSVSFKGGTS